MITSVLFFAILAPLSAVAQLHDGFYDVELRVVPVAGRVHMIQRPDGFANVGVFVGEEGVLLVDSQFEPHAEDLVSAVRKLSNSGFFPQAPVEARPFITYDDRITFHFNGEEVRVFLAPPAHTDGDTFVHFPESDVLHLGDVFRTTSYPIIDVYNGGTSADSKNKAHVARFE